MPQAGEESRSGAVAGRRSGPVRPASSGQIRPSRPRRAATPQRTETWRGIEPTCHDRAAAVGDNLDAFAGLVPPRARTTVPCDARNFLGSSHASHLLKSGAKPSAASTSPLSQNHIDAAPQTIANGAGCRESHGATPLQKMRLPAEDAHLDHRRFSKRTDVGDPSSGRWPKAMTDDDHLGGAIRMMALPICQLSKSEPGDGPVRFRSRRSRRKSDRASRRR
jgi:hypothetical protein